MKSYKSIRIACDILDRADRCGAEAFFLIGWGIAGSTANSQTK